MTKFAPALAAVLLIGCAHHPSEFTIGGPAPQPAPKDVSFAGTWAYNSHDSDQPGRGMRGFVGRGAAGGRFGGRGGFPGEGGFPGGGGFIGDEGGGGESGGQGEGRRMEIDSTLRRPPQRLVITQTDSTVTISPRDSVSYTLFFDGRYVVAPELLGGSRIELSGHWHGKRFEVVRRMGDGMIVTQGYEITHGGKRLVVHVQLSRGSSAGPMPEFQQVYDRE